MWKTYEKIVENKKVEFCSISKHRKKFQGIK